MHYDTSDMYTDPGIGMQTQVIGCQALVIGEQALVIGTQTLIIGTQFLVKCTQTMVIEKWNPMKSIQTLVIRILTLV